MYHVYLEAVTASSHSDFVKIAGKNLYEFFNLGSIIVCKNTGIDEKMQNIDSLILKVIYTGRSHCISLGLILGVLSVIHFKK